MATPTYKREPLKLEDARCKAQLLILRARRAELAGDPFCPERLQLYRLLRFRLAFVSDRVADLMNRAVTQGLPEAQQEAVALLETLIYDVGA